MKKLLTSLWLPGSLAAGFGQGSLTPPGAPAPTMKTLDQVEPRTPISSVPFTISAHGSYYFTTNLTASAGQTGINISSDDVTLDLNGFALDGGVNKTNISTSANTVVDFSILGSNKVGPIVSDPSSVGANAWANIQDNPPF